MPGENITQQTTEQIAQENQSTRSNQRITELSEKVELTSKERDEKAKLLEESAKKIAELERENAFNSGFADVLSTHSAAKDHKDEIKEKVLAGYSVEDATFAVLGKAGKLGGSQAPIATATQVAGGSAATTMQTGQKEIKDMSRDEMRNILSKELMWQ